MALMDKQLTVPMPAIVATILSILLGGAQAVLIGHIIYIPEQWREMGIVLVAFFAAEGIDPIVGGNAYAALKLPPWLTHLIAAILAALLTLSTSTSLPHLAATIAAGVVTVLAGMGFQPLTSAEAGTEPVVEPVVLPAAAPEPEPAPEPAVPLVSAPITVVTPTSEPPPVPEAQVTTTVPATQEQQAADRGVIS